MAEQPFATIGPYAEGRTGDRITEMWAWCTVDPHDNNEGIIAYGHMVGLMLPLVGADRERIENFRAYAQQVATETGQQVALVRLTRREDVEVLLP